MPSTMIRTRTKAALLKNSNSKWCPSFFFVCDYYAHGHTKLDWTTFSPGLYGPMLGGQATSDLGLALL